MPRDDDPAEEDPTSAPGAPADAPADLGTTAPVPEDAPADGTALPRPRARSTTPMIVVRDAQGREAEAFAREGYTLQSVLGRGGMGVVHEAWDARLRRKVAIKVTHEGARLSDVQRERFRREAIAAARVEHPGVVAVHGSGEVEGRPYLVLELVVGRSLAAALQERALGPREVAAVVRDVALALQHVHERGIVHRDVKPENVLLDEAQGGRPRLADFGLARDPAATEELTSTGDVMGTPAYMAPEQVRGDRDAQGPCTDIYALGGLLYRALGGRAPFQANSAPAVLRQILHDEPLPLRALNPAVHQDLETIALRCLQKEPARRYPTAAAVAEDLRRFLDGEPILARPVSRPERAWMWARRNARPIAALALAVALAATATAGGLHLARERGRRDDDARRARELAAAVLRAGREPLGEGSAERRAVADALACDPGPSGVAALSAALDAVTARLRDVERGLLLEAARGEPSQAGLAAALERARAGAPAASDAALVDAARRRLEARTDAMRPGNVLGASPTAALLVAAAQERALGSLGAQEARLLCEALARSGAPGAVPALARHLEAEHGESRALVAAEALCALGGPDALRAVQARARAFGPGPFQRRVARLLPADAGLAGLDALLQEGVARLAADDYPAAIAALGSALLLDPTSAEAWSQRALARRESGDDAGAIEDAERALALDPRSLRAHMARAGALLSLGRAQDAVAGVESAVVIAPRSPEALVLRGEARLLTRDLAGAQADFEAALAHDPRSASAWYGLGTARHQRNDVEGALDGFQHAVELDPQMWLAWLNLGTLRAGRGDLSGALADLTRAIDLRPAFAPAWSNRGNVKRTLGDVAGAVDDLERALELAPDDALVRMNLGLALLARGDLDAALRELDHAVRLRPGAAEAWNARGSARRAKGDLQGAIDDATRATELDPREPTGWFNRANARRRKGDLRGAEADYGRALELAPGAPRIAAARASVREALGDLEGALADLDRALALEPGRADAWGDRAAVKAARADLDGALADYTRALELDATLAWAWGGRAQVRMRRFEHEAAIADYSRTLELAPRTVDAWLRRGECRVQTGDAAGALADLERFLELAPANHPARRGAARERDRLRGEAR